MRLRHFGAWHEALVPAGRRAERCTWRPPTVDEVGHRDRPSCRRPRGMRIGSLLGRNFIRRAAQVLRARGVTASQELVAAPVVAITWMPIGKRGRKLCARESDGNDSTQRLRASDPCDPEFKAVV